MGILPAPVCADVFIYVQAVDDGVVENELEVTITHSWMDGAGGVQEVAGSSRVVVVIFDDDEGAIRVSGPGNLDEGEVAEFEVKLGAPPDGSVSVSASVVADGGRSGLSLTGGPLLFTTTNWDTKQIVQLSVPRDGKELGDTEVEVEFATSASLLEVRPRDLLLLLRVAALVTLLKP